MLYVGLTGGIATGKSVVAKIFAELGAYVIDADKIAHEMIEPGKPAYEDIIETFGAEILNEDKTINRKKLGRIVFSDQGARARLNSIVHPRIIEEEIRLASSYLDKNPRGIVIVDAALLVETGSYKRFDKLIVVYCDRQIQLARLIARDNISIDEAKARIKAQLPSEEKLKYADFKIDTSGTLRETRKQVGDIYKQLVLIEAQRCLP